MTHVIDKKSIEEDVKGATSSSQNSDATPVGIVTPELVERERRGNSRLTWVLVSLLVLVIALGISLFVFLAQHKAVSQNVERETIASAQQYLDSHPNEAAAYEQLAQAQIEAGDYQAALQTIEAGLTTTRDESLNLILGDAFRLAQQYTQAVSAYTKAEEYRLSVLGAPSVEDTASGGEVVAAEDQFLAQAYYGRALSELALGNNAAARTDFESATMRFPQSASMWTTLGDLYVTEGAIEKARLAYENALRYVPDYQPAREGLNRIEDGE